MKNIILVVAAHSDDEAMGCAGTIAKYVDQGDDVHLVFMTDGVASRDNEGGEANLRRQASKKAARYLQVKSVTQFNFPDNMMDKVPLIEIIKALEILIERISPNIIFTHHSNDLNIDHEITHRAVVTACRPLPSSCVKEIYAFEVQSSTEWSLANRRCFKPNTFVDISGYMSNKQKVLEIYDIEMRKSPHARNIDNCTRNSLLRGNTVGVDAAEAFEQILRIF